VIAVADNDGMQSSEFTLAFYWSF